MSASFFCLLRCAFSWQIRRKLLGLRGLSDRLRQLTKYLTDVLEGRLPHNHEIMSNLQTMIALLPNLAVDTLTKAMFVGSNDAHLVGAPASPSVCLCVSACVCWGPQGLFRDLRWLCS